MTEPKDVGGVVTGKGVVGSAVSSGGSFKDSRAEGEQSFSIERGEHELKTVTAERAYRLDRMRLEHELEEQKAENRARREREAREETERRKRDDVIYWLIVAAIIVGIVVGGAASFVSQNDATQRWGQSLVTLIVGGLVGYVTGSRAGK